MKLILEQTCGACPEQYDVFNEEGKQLAYYRLRHGYFRVDVPDVLGETIFEAYPKGDGIFEENEREFYLGLAAEKVREYYSQNENSL